MADGNNDDIVHRELDTEMGDAAVQVVLCVSELEGTDTRDLPSMYECIDGVLDDVFSSPPSPKARLEVTFSYHGYRITVEQNGTATFVKED